MLFTNGYLMMNRIAPILILNEEKAKFSNLLSNFYENGKADNIIRFLGETSTVKPEIDKNEIRNSEELQENRHDFEIEEYCDKILKLYNGESGYYFLYKDKTTGLVHIDIMPSEITPKEYENEYKNKYVIHSSYNIFSRIPKEAKQNEIVEIVKNEIKNSFLRLDIEDRKIKITSSNTKV